MSTRMNTVTEYERRILDILKEGGWLRPVQMISRHRDLLGDRTPQGVHQTCASLIRKGWIEKYAGPLGVSYHITPKGYAVIREVIAGTRAVAVTRGVMPWCPGCAQPPTSTRHTCGLKGLQAMLPIGGR